MCKIMKRIMRINIILLVGVLACMTACVQEQKVPLQGNLSSCEISFFGDSTAVFKANTLQNGYKISIIHNKQLNVIHFERGDSISRYCAIHTLPFDLRHYDEDSIGVFQVELDIPILRLDTLGGSKDAPDMFFMDVNFDGEEDFIVAHEGYNRTYYACFDLVNGNSSGSCPGLLESNNEPPYNNIVSGINVQPSYTVFNRQKKEIYIYETMGCCSYYETWAKHFERDDFGNEAKIKIIKEIHHDLWADGTEHIEIYKLINDTLKLVENKVVE